MQVVDIKDVMLYLVHNLGRLLLGSEFFYGGFVSDEGNGINNRVRLWEAVDG